MHALICDAMPHVLPHLPQVEWASPPRPLTEFFARFTPPKTGAKWQSRLKCNLYYYRTNYFCLILLCLLGAFYRNPGALLATLLSSVSVLCLNDTFATSFRCAVSLAASLGGGRGRTSDSTPASRAATE